MPIQAQYKLLLYIIHYIESIIYLYLNAISVAILLSCK